MVRLCLAAVALLVSTTAVPHSAGLPDVVSFARGSGPVVVVPVRVNGAGPFPFMVDTGSSHTSIDVSLAVELGAPRVAKTLVSSATGDEWAAVVRLDRVELGPLVSNDVLATEVPESRLVGLANVQGVIGLDILGTRAFSLDFAIRQMSWITGASGAGAITVPLTSLGGMWFVAAGGVSGATGGSSLLMLDSGADTLLLFARSALQGVAWGVTSSTARTVVGPQQVRLGRVHTLRLGSVELRDLGVAVMDGKAIPRVHGDGLLPLHLFDRVTFYPSEGVVTLLPARNRDDDTARIQ